MIASVFVRFTSTTPDIWKALSSRAVPSVLPMLLNSNYLHLPCWHFVARV